MHFRGDLHMPDHPCMKQEGEYPGVQRSSEGPEVRSSGQPPSLDYAKRPDFSTSAGNDAFSICRFDHHCNADCQPSWRPTYWRKHFVDLQAPLQHNLRPIVMLATHHLRASLSAGSGRTQHLAFSASPLTLQSTMSLLPVPPTCFHFLRKSMP